MKTKAKKKFKYIEAANKHRALHEFILQLVGMDEYQAFWHRVEVAIKFVEDNTYKWVSVRNDMLSSKSFWMWFNNQWDIRNEQFVHEYDLLHHDGQIDQYMILNLKSWYISMHEDAINPETKMGQNLLNSYAAMMQNFIDESHAQKAN